ncbi:MAG: helix-turn-helix transcriptional regulator [Smithellaceae bacterium]
MPTKRYLRLCQIIGTLAASQKKRSANNVDRKTEEPLYQPIIPVSRSTWWAGVRSGRYPAPVKLSSRCSAWAEEAIDKLAETLGAEGM